MWRNFYQIGTSTVSSTIDGWGCEFDPQIRQTKRDGIQLVESHNAAIVAELKAAGIRDVDRMDLLQIRNHFFSLHNEVTK